VSVAIWICRVSDNISGARRAPGQSAVYPRLAHAPWQ
jgi:hypothetical protein